MAASTSAQCSLFLLECRISYILTVIAVLTLMHSHLDLS